MKKAFLLTSLLSLNSTAYAVTIYGGLGNFDAVNDTGVEAHGFEIELDDVISTQIGGTYDYNHYGHPIITQDDSIPGHPKVFVRYQAKYDAVTGQWSSFTTFPVNGLPATQGHQCTNPAVNLGCEHFAASSYPVASSMTYSWLIEDPAHPGTLVRAANSMVVATPNWSYVPPAPQQPAQVVAVMPAPVVVPKVVPPVVYEFGTPSFVKVIKTKAHNANQVVLEQLIGGDKDGDGQPDWANKEVQEVESEFYLLQKGTNQAKAAHDGKAEQVNAGDNITRRYEFYKYAGSAATIDGETHEAMCDEVGPDGLHGLRSNVGVTDVNGNTQYVDCTQEVVVGDYTGANMVGFEAVAALGLIDHIEDGQINKDYVARSLAFGGNTPYDVAVAAGALPQGLSIDPITGILTGAPTEAGLFTFTVNTTDADNTLVTKTYTINILDANGQNVLDVPAITSNALADGIELADYYLALTATSGTAPYSWTVTPALPNGLILSADGIVSGQPALGTAGTSTHTFTVTDSKGKSADKLLALNVLAPPSIITSALPDVFVGSVVNLPIEVTTPNNDAYTLAITSVLPAGLTFNNATNAIEGTPTVISAVNSPFSIDVTVTDTVTQLTATKTLSLSINDNAIAFAPVLPTGVEQAAYPATSVAATGGYGAFTYAVTGGALPAGLTLTGDTINGTPTTAGTYLFTLTATDSLGTAQQFNASITIDAAPVIVPPTGGNYTVKNEGHGKISAVGSDYLMVGNKKLIWNAATKFEQETHAGEISVLNPSLIKLNRTKVEWKGLLDKATNTVLTSKIEIH
ncbi:MAG: putative Ig domain-containing protein [Methylovulum sp.]|nr:putative Ig domain-containing protein [Methylovulum sp.]